MLLASACGGGGSGGSDTGFTALPATSAVVAPVASPPAAEPASPTPAPKTFLVGGTVQGLLSSGLTLRLNGADDLPIEADGEYRFATRLPEGAGFEVTIGQQPKALGQLCTLDSGAGQIASADVLSVVVTCGPRKAKRLYLNARDQIIPFDIDDQTGALTAGPGSAFNPFWTQAAVHPVRPFLYAQNEQPGELVPMLLDEATGQPGASLIAPLRPGVDFAALEIDPTGGFMYALDPGNDRLRGFSIDAATGALAPLADAAPPLPPFANALEFHPSGKYFYVASDLTSPVRGYQVDQGSGAVQALPDPGPDVPTATAMAMDPKGRFLHVWYFASADGRTRPNRLVTLGIDPKTGALTSTASTPYPGSGLMANEASGRFLYVAGQDVINILRIDPVTGSTSPASHPSIPIPAALPDAMRADPTGRFLYVGVNRSELLVYRIDAVTGELTPSASSVVVPGFGLGNVIRFR